MRTIKSTLMALVSLASFLLNGGTALAQLSIQDVRVVDVTPSSFSVVWRSSAPSAPEIRVFLDQQGNSEITGDLAVTPFPLIAGNPDLADGYLQDENKHALQAEMKSLGINRVRVSGLDPNTSYYFRVASHAGAEISQLPAASEPPLPVKTMISNRFISSSVQVMATLDGAGAKGWVVYASTPGALYPVSGVVGDGVKDNEVFLNLANLFDQSGQNLEPGLSIPATFTILSGTTSEQLFDITVSGGFSVSSVNPITLPVSSGDTSAPIWPAGSSLTVAGVGSTSATLSWGSALDNVGVTGYRLYRNGTLETTLGAGLTSYTSVSLSPGATYSFSVEAVDGAGNSSTGNPAVTVTTASSKTGDCDGNGLITIDEVQSAVNMYLGVKTSSTCVDTNNDGVSIDEVQKVINGYLGL